MGFGTSAGERLSKEPKKKERKTSWPSFGPERMQLFCACAVDATHHQSLDVGM
jgi:hypothetical protein